MEDQADHLVTPCPVLPIIILGTTTTIIIHTDWLFLGTRLATTRAVNTRPLSYSLPRLPLPGTCRWNKQSIHLTSMNDVMSCYGEQSRGQARAGVLFLESLSSGTVNSLCRWQGKQAEGAYYYHHTRNV